MFLNYRNQHAKVVLNRLLQIILANIKGKRKGCTPMDDFIKRKFISYIKTLSKFMTDESELYYFLQQLHNDFFYNSKERPEKWKRKEFLENLDLIQKVLQMNLYDKSKKKCFMMIKSIYK